MKTSCGILIFNNNGEILLCHTNEQKSYDIPKGLLDEGESFIDCAIRECKEETSLIFDKDDLTELGMVPYNKKKQLYLFSIITDIVKIENLKCESLFESLYTKKMIPEVDSYKWVKFSDIKDYCTNNMTNAINSCITLVTYE